MFNTAHILYMVISAVISVGILALARKFAKTDKAKDYVLRFFAIITVVIHYSSLWVEFFTNNEEASVSSTMLLPIHPCNVVMWLLLITSFIKNKQSLIGKTLAEFVFWAGIICGSIGIIVNENYGSNPTLADYDVLKGLLSHSTMLIGCIFVLVGGYIKIRVINVRSVAMGLALFVVDGLIINGLYAIFKLDPCNSMYLLEPPFDNMPWLNTLTIGIIGVSVCFIVTAIYEYFCVPEEERWYNELKVRLHK